MTFRNTDFLRSIASATAAMVLALVCLTAAAGPATSVAQAQNSTIVRSV